MKKTIVLFLVLFTCTGAFSADFQISTISQSPNHVCKNMNIFISKLRRFVDIELLSCEMRLKEEKIFSSDEYSVNIVVSINFEKCHSEENQVISFNIPTNTYYHWNPPMPFGYIQALIGRLGFESPISVRNIGPNQTPAYEQMVIIPECSFK